MRATLTMTWNDLRIFFSKPGNWLGLGLLPVLFTVGLGFAFGPDGGGSAPRLVVDVIDEDGSGASARLLDELVAANDMLLLCAGGVGAATGDACDLGDAPLTLARGEERVRAGESDALLVIPAGYGEAVAEASPITLAFYSDTTPPTPDPVLQTLEAVLQRVNSAALTAGVANAVLVRLGEAGGAALIEPWQAAFAREVYTKTESLLGQRPPAVNFVMMGEDDEEAGPNAASGFTQSVPGVGSMYVMFTVFGGMVLIQRDRQRWTLQRLGVFPLRRSQILGAKILTYFTLGMLQYLLVFGVGLAVGMDFGAQPWLLWLPMIAFVLCCTALTFAIAPALQSENQASAVTQMLSLTFASLGGAWWPLEIVPNFMQVLAHATPVAWVMDAFRDLLYYGGDLAAVAPEIGVLLGAAALLFGVGIWRFRYM